MTDSFSIQNHPDLKYLNSSAVGGVIIEGLEILYNVQPSNPVQYLAEWLLNYCVTANRNKDLE